MIEATPFQLYKRISKYVAQNKIKILLGNAGKSCQASSVYNGLYYEWCDLTEKDDCLLIDHSYPYESVCRGWIQEAWLHAKLNDKWTNVPNLATCPYEVSFINKGPTVFLIWCSKKRVAWLTRAVEVINSLETKNKWYKSRLINISGNRTTISKGETKEQVVGDIYLLVGSRNWKHHFILISAYLLIIKSTVLNIGNVGSMEETINWLKKCTYNKTNLLFYHDLINVLMKNHKYITGDYNETILKSLSEIHIHSIGFGEYGLYIDELCRDYFRGTQEKPQDFGNPKDKFPDWDIYKRFFEPLVCRTIEKLLECHGTQNCTATVRAA